MAEEQTTPGIISHLRLEHEMSLLRERIDSWITHASEEMREALRWQFDSGSKFFRPLTIFSCHRAVSREPISAALVKSALVLEMFHNVSLIIDDIVDKSGAWYSYNGQKIGQGRENAKLYLKDSPALMAEVEEKVKALLGVGPREVINDVEVSEE